MDPEKQQLSDDGISVSLTPSPLDVTSTMATVKNPQAGAIVLFAGTTRDNFAGKPVKQLEYSSYPPLALRTMLSIAQTVKVKHGLTAISMVHRLGVVPISEESILIAVSSPHRQAAWKGGEEALELCWNDRWTTETVLTPLHNYENAFSGMAKKALDEGLADALTRFTAAVHGGH
ncbi:MAG: hypothetical protein Q9195_000961 [Heterodermia aff. obscurata]